MTRAGTARRGIYMSDGVMNVALLKTEGNEKEGIYHFGMWVDDLDEAEKKVLDAGGAPSGRPADLAEFVLRGKIPRPERRRVRSHPQRLGRSATVFEAGEAVAEPITTSVLAGGPP